LYNIHSILQVTDGWLLNQDPIYNNEGTAFLQIMPQNVSGKFYRHIAVLENNTKPVS